MRQSERCHAVGWRDRYGVKRLSPNLIIVKFTFVSLEYKMDFSCGENRQKWVPLFYYTVKNCSRVCGLFLENAKHPRGMIWRGGLHTWMKRLNFTVFTLKTNEWILCLHPRRLSVFIPQHPSPSLSLTFSAFVLSSIADWYGSLDTRLTGMSWGQTVVVELEFMFKSAMSLPLNGVSCHCCMKSP